MAYWSIEMPTLKVILPYQRFLVYHLPLAKAQVHDHEPVIDGCRRAGERRLTREGSV